MNIRPLSDRVIVQRVEAESVTTEVKIKGQEYLIMNESDIMAIIEG